MTTPSVEHRWWTHMVMVQVHHWRMFFSLCSEYRGHAICCPRGQHLILTLVRLVQWAHVRSPLLIDTGVGFEDVLYLRQI